MFKRMSTTRGAEIAQERGLPSTHRGIAGTATAAVETRNAVLEQSEQLARIEALLERIAVAAEWQARATYDAAQAARGAA
jgi:hypothetical protein